MLPWVTTWSTIIAVRDVIKCLYSKLIVLSQWEMFAAAINLACLIIMISGPWFNINMSSYQYRKSHCGDKTILRPSYLHNGISHTGKKTDLYWISLPWSPLNISYMNWDQMCSWSRALTQHVILIPSHLLSCACKTVILSWCWWNFLPSANQIAQIGSCDRSRIHVPDLGGTGVWPGKKWLS